MNAGGVAKMASASAAWQMGGARQRRTSAVVIKKKAKKAINLARGNSGNRDNKYAGGMENQIADISLSVTIEKSEKAIIKSAEEEGRKEEAIAGREVVISALPIDRCHLVSFHH